jgi:hypothetical protein
MTGANHYRSFGERLLMVRRTISDDELRPVFPYQNVITTLMVNLCAATNHLTFLSILVSTKLVAETQSQSGSSPVMAGSVVMP